MDDLLGTAARAMLAFGLAVGGGALAAGVGVSHARLCALISLAAGTLTGVTLFSIVPETWGALAWWKFVLALGSGYALFALISKYVFHVCPACAASHFDEATTHRFSEIASALIIALAIHSTMDGVALVAGHEAHSCLASGHDHAHAHGSGAMDWSLVVAICIHKVPEGLALGALLIGAGFRRARAIGWVAAVEATTLLGAALGWWFVRGTTPHWLAAVLAHVGGGFMFLAVHAVFGELLRHGRAAVLGSFAGGVLLIAALHVILRVL